MNGEIVAIWRKRFKGGPMDPIREAKLVAGRGLAGNANQGGKRQVTLVDERAWNDALNTLGTEVDPSARRANILLRGIDLENSRGKLLRIGECLVLLHGETRPCEQMDDAQPGLRSALKPDWRAGAYGEILKGGAIRVGDVVSWATASEENPAVAS